MPVTRAGSPYLAPTLAQFRRVACARQLTANIMDTVSPDCREQLMLKDLHMNPELVARWEASQCFVVVYSVADELSFARLLARAVSV